MRSVRQGRDGRHDRRVGKKLRAVLQHEFQRGIGDRQDDVDVPPVELALDVVAQRQGRFLRGKAIGFQVLGEVVDGLRRVRQEDLPDGGVDERRARKVLGAPVHREHRSRRLRLSRGSPEL